VIIATRKLRIVATPNQEVEVRIHAPQESGIAWICSFEISWPSGTYNGHAMGADAVQALGLTLQNIAAQLYMSPYHKDRRLIWQESGAGYGFPLHPKSRDLAIGDDRAS
jgi:hypothetical protein